VDHSTSTTTSTANFADSLKNIFQYNNALSKSINPWNNLGFNINLQQKFGSKGAELDADADYIYYRAKSPQYSNNYLYSPDGNLINDPLTPNPYLLNGYLPSNIDIYTFKADYSQPLKNNYSLEAGIKTSFVKTNNDAQYSLFDSVSGKWNTDEGRSNHFIYKENINAAYFTLQKTNKKNYCKNSAYVQSKLLQMATRLQKIFHFTATIQNFSPLLM